ncbi:MAG: hypothetical protein ACEY3H_01810 [Wolbachia sp.]
MSATRMTRKEHWNDKKRSTGMTTKSYSDDKKGHWDDITGALG